MRAAGHPICKNMLLISIPKPCHENWDAMLPNEKGAFCNACAKTVVDFTGKTDEEVTQYFLAHRAQKTCGRFNNTQLIPPAIDLPQLLSSAVPYWKKFLAVLFIAFGSLMTGCSDDRVLGKTATMGEPLAPAARQAVDTVPVILGDTSFVVLNTTVQKPVDKAPACGTTTGKMFVPKQPLKKPTKSKKE